MPIRPPSTLRLVALLVLLAGLPACRSARTAATGPPARVTSTASEPEGLRVMSFNIRYNTPNDGVNAWPNRRAHVADLMRYYDADLYGLQEVLAGQLDDVLDALPAYSPLGVGRTDGKREGEYAPILYRRDRFEVRDHGTFWLSETPSDTGSVGWDAALPRIVTWARFRMSDGQEFYHFNTHFDHRGVRARKESARLLVSEITRLAGGLPVVVTGDFNTQDDADGYDILTEHNRRDADRSDDALRDARREAEFAAGPERTHGGFDLDLRPGRPIDYIFVKNGFDPTYFVTLVDNRNGRFPSDHRPVMADLDFPETP